MENKQDEFVGLPDWVQYIATDFSGQKYGYENKPFKSDNGKWWFVRDGRVIDIKARFDWENSLIERKK